MLNNRAARQSMPWIFLVPVLLLALTACEPSRTQLARQADQAADLGWRAMVERLTTPSVKALENGGWVYLVNREANHCQLFGPGMYVESQTYDIGWFLAGHIGIGWRMDGSGGLLRRSKDQLLSDRTIQLLLATQHPESGSWPWSDDGCIHEFMGMALWYAGEKEAARKSVDWIANWTSMHRLQQDGTMLETDGQFIITSWGITAPIPRPYDGSHPQLPLDEKRLAVDEMTMFLRMLIVTGMDEKYPKIKKNLIRGMDKFLRDPGIGRRNSLNFITLYGIVDYANMVDDGLLPRDEMYERALHWIRHLAIYEKAKTTEGTLSQCCLLIGLSTTPLIDEEAEATDQLVHKLLSFQDAGGEWLMPICHYLPQPVQEKSNDLRDGNIIGDVESLTTYHAALALKCYAHAILRNGYR